MTEMPPYLAVKDEEKNTGQTDSECSDSEDDLPLSFNKPRHIELIKGAEREEHSWRVKEKVILKFFLYENCTEYNCVSFVEGHVILKTNAHGLFVVFV